MQLLLICLQKHLKPQNIGIDVLQRVPNDELTFGALGFRSRGSDNAQYTTLSKSAAPLGTARPFKP